MNQAIDQIQRLVTPLLATLESLGSSRAISIRRIFPACSPALDRPRKICARRGQCHRGRIPTPPSVAQLDNAADEALAAFDGLRTAATAPEGLRVAYRALRHVPRALEALYPLAGILPPVNRFFLDAERRMDDEFQARFLKPPPADTGVMCFGDDPKCARFGVGLCARNLRA